MDWELKERSKKCILCDKKFFAGDHYKSALFKNKEELKQLLPDDHPWISEENNVSGLKNHAYRCDVCEECWEHQLKSKEFESRWVGQFIQKKIKLKKHQLTKNEVYLVFEEKYDSIQKLIHTDEDLENIAVTYFLALWLERKNVIQLIDENVEKQLLVYKRPQNEQIFNIKQPLLSFENMKTYKEKMNELLFNHSEDEESD